MYSELIWNTFLLAVAHMRRLQEDWRQDRTAARQLLAEQAEREVDGQLALLLVPDNDNPTPEVR